MEIPMKHGARNDIPAKVTNIKRGGVMAQVDVQLEGTDYKMSSVMTLESVDALGLQVGDMVHVLAKAVNVLLVKP
jgi:molybdopterin-binding protein